jgi:hypothetical protein
LFLIGVRYPTVSKRSKQSIRFGITDGSGKRAATWNCWTHIGGGKSDVYLACRSIGYALKVSLHETGDWHIAYSEKFFVENLEALADRPQGRFIDKWTRPREIGPINPRPPYYYATLSSQHTNYIFA